MEKELCGTKEDNDAVFRKSRVHSRRAGLITSSYYSTLFFVFFQDPHPVIVVRYVITSSIVRLELIDKFTETLILIWVAAGFGQEVGYTQIQIKK